MIGTEWGDVRLSTMVRDAPQHCYGYKGNLPLALAAASKRDVIGRECRTTR